LLHVPGGARVRHGLTAGPAPPRTLSDWRRAVMKGCCIWLLLYWLRLAALPYFCSMYSCFGVAMGCACCSCCWPVALCVSLMLDRR
jgi:hypothetical protein